MHSSANLSTSPLILVIDLEATCDEAGVVVPRHEMEIIEIGAVWVDRNGRAIRNFQTFVQPVVHPELTPFCTALTHINQTDVADAPTFAGAALALAEFASLYSQESPTWGSWGRYDFNQVALDSALHGVANPLTGMRHINLKNVFARSRPKHIREVGLSKALRIAGLTFQGSPHRAIDDALNTARLIPGMLTELLQQAAPSSAPVS